MNEIKIYKQVYESDFIYDLRKKELEKIILETELIDNHLTVHNSYVYINEGVMEVGAYLINNSNKVLDIKTIPISAYCDKKLVGIMDVDINKVIKSKEAIFKEIKFTDNNLHSKQINEEVSLGFGELNSIKKYPHLNIDINELPKVNGYKSYREGKKFLKNLSNIEENQFSIDIFKVGQVEEGFCIIALFRNSSSKAINIKSIPLTVLVSENLPVYKGVYNINDDGLIIESNKGKFYSIIIPLESFIQIDYEDMSKYIVKFE
ncbi:SLAP domain-containing protein [Clostridium algidicarnis]|uniref:SLAP domain-containing protein n=1 Tax=Clostridium algidicarnis TaxID=37659 RepID=UPI001C0B140F|nr:SLAP domain-containing protein [Clostridium algidicarnis]MBU3209369.1 SLAP domain-containing protein [Clostridium algidicarnis]